MSVVWGHELGSCLIVFEFQIFQGHKYRDRVKQGILPGTTIDQSKVTGCLNAIDFQAAFVFKGKDTEKSWKLPGRKPCGGEIVKTALIQPFTACS